jgi:hypothetical protein
VIPDLRVKLACPLDALLADGLLDLVVVVAAFLQGQVIPLLEPIPVGQGHQGAGALVFAACQNSGKYIFNFVQILVPSQVIVVDFLPTETFSNAH